VVVSKLSQGGVEAFIEATAESELNDGDIKKHPLMQWEISLQQELLALIDSSPKNSQTCKTLKELALREGMSNIGIEVN